MFKMFPKILSLQSALNDSSYRETIESSSNYNNRLVVERKTRIPFIDSQTGNFVVFFLNPFMII